MKKLGRILSQKPEAVRTANAFLSYLRLLQVRYPGIDFPRDTIRFMERTCAALEFDDDDELNAIWQLLPHRDYLFSSCPGSSTERREQERLERLFVDAYINLILELRGARF